MNKNGILNPYSHPLTSHGWSLKLGMMNSIIGLNAFFYFVLFTVKYDSMIEELYKGNLIEKCL